MAKKVPLRQCLGCREMMPKSELIRIVRSNDGQFAVDATGKLNGRGAYICKKSECLKKAVGSKALEKAFKVSIPAEVYEQLDKELRDIEEYQDLLVNFSVCQSQKAVQWQFLSRESS